MAMVGQVLGVYEYVIDVDNHKVIEELPEHLVHKPLEEGRGIVKAIWHDEIFVVPRWGNEARLPLIALPRF